MESQPELGPYSFHVVLRRTGDLIFFYDSVPAPMSEISPPVTVGLTDGGHRIHFDPAGISNETCVYLRALHDRHKRSGDAKVMVTEDDHDYYLRIVVTGDVEEYEASTVNMEAAKEFEHLTGQSKSAESYTFSEGRTFRFYGHDIEKVR